MSDEPTASVSVQRIKRVELAKIGKRAVSVYGYRNDLVEDHLKWHLGQAAPRPKWCRVECLAKTMFGRNTEMNREGIRRRIHATFRTLLRRGLFLTIEYADTKSHGRILAFKLFENDGEFEKRYALEQLDRMARSQQIKAETLARARSVIGVSDDEAECTR